MPLLRFLAIDAPDSGTRRHEYHLPGEKLLRGNPLQQAWSAYEGSEGRFHSGVWRSEVGKWRVNYSEEEYCEILEGVSVIADERGNVVTVRKGDRFVVPRGFAGTWEVVEPTRKIYVIYEPGA